MLLFVDSSRFVVSDQRLVVAQTPMCGSAPPPPGGNTLAIDRKSTRLNSSHSQISYAVFCLKKKKEMQLHDSVGSEKMSDGHNMPQPRCVVLSTFLSLPVP